MINLIALLLVVGLQTNTPTPTPTTFHAFPPALEFKSPNTPTPIPTVTPFVLPTGVMPFEDVYNQLATAENQLAAAPDSLNDTVPFETGVTLFGYVKWLYSPNILDELFGVLSPIPAAFAVIIGLVLAILSVYFIVRVVVLIIKLIIWIIWKIKSFIPTLAGGMWLFPVTPTPFPTPDPLTNPFTLPPQKLWSYTDEAIQNWHLIGDGWTTLIQGVLLMLIIVGGLSMVILWAKGMIESDRGKE